MVLWRVCGVGQLIFVTMCIRWLLMRSFFSFILLLLLLLQGTTVLGAPATETGASGELITRQRGNCVITVPRKNEGVISTLSKICVGDVPRIFQQLGAVGKDGKFDSVSIRVVSHPSEMHSLAPQGTSLPLWSGAVAIPTHNRVMLPLLRLDGGPANDLETTLIHEISHVAFYRASAGARTPRWFSEGVAILQSEGSSHHRSPSIWWASLIDDIQPLSDIAHYPKGAKAAEQAYAQAADFSAFLIEREGWAGVRFLLANLKSGETFDAAFRQAYGVRSETLEKEWRAQLFGGMGWLMQVTSDAMWLGLAAVLCIAGFFLVRRRKKKRLKEMEAEEKHLEDAIATLDELIAERPSPLSPGPPETLVMDRLKKRGAQIEIDGKIHTLH